jgi:hypothetical protein
VAGTEGKAAPKREQGLDPACCRRSRRSYFTRSDRGRRARLHRSRGAAKQTAAAGHLQPHQPAHGVAHEGGGLADDVGDEGAQLAGPRGEVVEGAGGKLPGVRLQPGGEKERKGWVSRGGGGATASASGV